MQQGKHVWGKSDGPTSIDLRCRWYIARNGKSDGPYVYEELVYMARQGQLTSSHYVWRPGFAQWISVSSRSDLRRELPPIPSLGVVPTIDSAHQQKTTDVRLSRDLLDAVPASRPRVKKDEHKPGVFSMHAIPEMNLSAWDATTSPKAEPVDDISARLGLRSKVKLSGGDIPLEEDLALANTEVMDVQVMRATGTAAQIGLPMVDDEDGYPPVVRPRWKLRSALIIGGVVVVASCLTSELWDKLSVRSSLPTVKGQPTPKILAPSAPDSSLPRLPHRSSPPSEGPKSPSKPSREPQETGSVVPSSSSSEDYSWLNRRRAAERVPTPQSVEVATKKVRQDWSVGASIELQPSSSRRILSIPPSLSDEAAGRVVASHLASLVRCARVDRRNHSLPEGAEIGLVVSGPGEVTGASIRGVSRPVARCVRIRSRTWTFPAVASASRVRVHVGRGGMVKTYVHHHRPADQHGSDGNG